MIWCGVGTSFAFLAIRLFARWKSFRKLFLDDIAVIFAWALALLTAIDWQVVAGPIYQFMAFECGRLWPLPASFVNDMERYSKGAMIVLIFFYTSLGAVKLSFLLFFRRLGHNVTGPKFLWWCILTITLLTYLLCIRTIQYSCLAFSFQYTLLNCSKPSAIHFELVTLKLNCAYDVVTDFLSISHILYACEGRKLLTCNSYVYTCHDALERSSVVPQKNCLDRIFSLVVITSVFAIVCVALVSSIDRRIDTSWAYMWSSIEQCFGNSYSPFSLKPPAHQNLQQSLFHASPPSEPFSSKAPTCRSRDQASAY